GECCDGEVLVVVDGFCCGAASLIAFCEALDEACADGGDGHEQRGQEAERGDYSGTDCGGNERGSKADPSRAHRPAGDAVREHDPGESDDDGDDGGEQERLCGFVLVGCPDRVAGDGGGACGCRT